jgi:hypothetical protein
MTTVNVLHAPTKVRVNDAVRQLRRDLKAERLFRMWAQLRREYWLGQRTQETSSRSLDLGSVDGQVQLTAVGADDIEEFPLQLQCEDVRALVETARREGLSAAGLARRLIGDYLRQTRSTVLVKNVSAGRNHP